MPDSPLVRTETVALNDLEALIAARAKGESETELGFRRRIDQEERDYRTNAQQLAGKYKLDSESLDAQFARARQDALETYQRTADACQAEYKETKQRLDDQLKKEQRRAKKNKEEAGWQALAVF